MSEINVYSLRPRSEPCPKGRKGNHWQTKVFDRVVPKFTISSWQLPNTGPGIDDGARNPCKTKCHGDEDEGVFEGSHSQNHLESPVVIPVASGSQDGADVQRKTNNAEGTESKKKRSTVDRSSSTTDDATTDMSLAKSDEEESLDRDPSPETERVGADQIPLFPLGKESRMVPPAEVSFVLEPPPIDIATIMDVANLRRALEDAELRAQTYRSKLEKSEDLVASLFRDLEKARRSTHTLVSRNVTLAGDLKSVKLDQEENMIHRNSLIKACMYVMPVFVLCGGLEVFSATIIFVWVLLELELSMKSVGPSDKGQEENHHHSAGHKHHRRKQRLDPLIPKDIAVEVKSGTSNEIAR